MRSSRMGYVLKNLFLAVAGTAPILSAIAADQPPAPVITSYSIHYTKLYEERFWKPISYMAPSPPMETTGGQSSHSSSLNCFQLNCWK